MTRTGVRPDTGRVAGPSRGSGIVRPGCGPRARGAGHVANGTRALGVLIAITTLAACDMDPAGLDRFPTTRVEKLGPTTFRVTQDKGARPTVISRAGFETICGPLGLQASRITADAPAGSNPRPFILECGTTPLSV